LLDYVFIDNEGNLIGGSYVRPHDPAGDRPHWVTINPSDPSEDPVTWVNPPGAYDQIRMPLTRALRQSERFGRLPGGGHALERRGRSTSKAATASRRLRARGSFPTSARSSSICPDGHYWSWSKKRCVKSRYS